LFCGRVDETHPNRPETDTAITLITKIPMRWKLQRVRKIKAHCFAKRVDETHPIRRETETALMSDNKDSNSQEITKSMGEKGSMFSRREWMKHILFARRPRP